MQGSAWLAPDQPGRNGVPVLLFRILCSSSGLLDSRVDNRKAVLCAGYHAEDHGSIGRAHAGAQGQAGRDLPWQVHRPGPGRGVPPASGRPGEDLGSRIFSSLKASCSTGAGSMFWGCAAASAHTGSPDAGTQPCRCVMQMCISSLQVLRCAACACSLGWCCALSGAT